MKNPPKSQCKLRQYGVALPVVFSAMLEYGLKARDELMHTVGQLLRKG